MSRTQNPNQNTKMRKLQKQVQETHREVFNAYFKKDPLWNEFDDSTATQNLANLAKGFERRALKPNPPERRAPASKKPSSFVGTVLSFFSCCTDDAAAQDERRPLQNPVGGNGW